MKRLATAIALVAVFAAGPGVASASVKVSYGSFYSNAMRGTLHYSVALPSGYAKSGKSYPVVYYLHGLPAGGQT